MHRPRSAFALAALALLPAAALAATGRPKDGQYCLFGATGKAYDMLLLRSLPAGALRFAFETWTDKGSYFGVAGTAKPTAQGWRYQADMTSPDPARRCSVTIARSPDGALRIATDEGARCEDRAGYGAVLYYPATFPPGSRVGPAPATITAEEAMRIGCARPGG